MNCPFTSRLPSSDAFANQQREQVVQHSLACVHCTSGEPCEMGLLLIHRWFQSEADTSLVEDIALMGTTGIRAREQARRSPFVTLVCPRCGRRQDALPGSTGACDKSERGIPHPVEPFVVEAR